MNGPLARAARAGFNAEITVRAARGGRANRRALAGCAGPTDIFLCVVDHYEPSVGAADRQKARERVCDWVCRYPAIAASHRDADGKMPPHSFFYPWDEYDAWEMDQLAELCAGGFGEIDLHLHHRDDTAQTLRAKLRDAVVAFRSHGALTVWPNGRPAWGFIHGNWALDNSRFENGRNFCGVNSEISILQEEGCYADFTFPAWRHAAQPRQTNNIYYAADDPERPKSHESGTGSRVGSPAPHGLLLIQGPLTPYVDLSRGRPRVAMDDPDIAAWRRYQPSRLDRWIRTGIHVAGRPDRVFIKLHSHGAADNNRKCLLGADLNALYSDAEARYNDGSRYRLHYVTAREMFNIVKATEAGIDEVARCRDWLLPPPDLRSGGERVSDQGRQGGKGR